MSLLRFFGYAFCLSISFASHAEPSICNLMRDSLGDVDARSFAKCENLQAQQVSLFSGYGSSKDFDSCVVASARAQANGLNKCKQFAVTSGLNPADCHRLENFKVSEGYACDYKSIYFLQKGSWSSVDITLTEDLRLKLQTEGAQLGMTVPQYIYFKLQK